MTDRKVERRALPAFIETGTDLDNLAYMRLGDCTLADLEHAVALAKECSDYERVVDLQRLLREYRARLTDGRTMGSCEPWLLGD
jgi:hypothetical protein